MVERDVVALDEVDLTRVAEVGGKAAGLGELLRLDGVAVPAGVCVTTAAYRRVVGADATVAEQVARLAAVDPEADGARAELAERAAAVRRAVAAVVVPDDLRAAVEAAVVGLGVGPFAVRSSATTEDGAAASAAGQQETYLDVVAAAVVDHVVRCWASLFTERAVAYRADRGVDPRSVAMGVVVQRMVPADAAGVLFTADPVTGHRRVTVVEAVRGSGEALVSGRAQPEVHTVRDGVVTVVPGPDGPGLDEGRVRELEALGRRIESHAGAPQDVEWCLDGHGVHVVQSRPITTLYPLPEAGDDAPHVYVSVGHQQMMTDAMRPLGLSVWQMTTPRPMAVAGGRLFVDVAVQLAVPSSRAALLDLFGRSDPLVVDALETVLARGGLVPAGPADTGAAAAPEVWAVPDDLVPADLALVEALVERTRASVARLREEVGHHRGPDLFPFLREDVAELRGLMAAPDVQAVLKAGFAAAWWVDDRMAEWLGVEGASAVLTRSVPHNVTSEMGLELLDVADVVRPHPEVVAFLEGVAGDAGPEVLDELAGLSPGGAEAAAALRAYLDRYGVRCVGEIDVTRPRWSEVPGALAPLVLGHVASFAPGEAARRTARGRAEAEAAARDMLERVRALPDGEAKAAEAEAMIARLRAFTGFREHPKYGMVSRYAVYRSALLEEADRLVAAGVLADRDDATFLTFDELEEAVRAQRVDAALVAERRAQHALDRERLAPRVLTSDGEALQGSFRREDLPPGALAGLGVSAGVVEGRARVVTDLSGADLVPGDVLVTRFTDPSWSPGFVTVAGLVTEVGGRTTHGAVVAREYGLPAVVGVEAATARIPDGATVRIDGTRGTVEVL